jgi:N-acetylglucosaminyl-diphospho-decaprenol L-rhamnosyltransferase
VGALEPRFRLHGPVAVAVVNFNTREQLHACLASIVADSPGEVVVVDNASRDGSAKMVRSAYPDVTLLANPVNGGYGSAANQAIAACASPHVLLLNADTRLRPGALEALRVHLDKHPAAAVVGPRLVDADGVPQTSCFAFPGPLHTFFQTTFFGSLIRRLPGLCDLYRPPYCPDLPCRVPWLLGAALAVRRAAFNAVGGFDESFFLYSEEVDLCYRFAAAGWEVHFTPYAEVVHVGGASAEQQAVETEPQRYAATQRFYRKHYPGWAQHVLSTLMTYRMCHNIARDAIRLAVRRQADQRAQLETQLAIWRRVLKGTWGR